MTFSNEDEIQKRAKNAKTRKLGYSLEEIFFITLYDDEYYVTALLQTTQNIRCSFPSRRVS